MARLLVRVTFIFALMLFSQLRRNFELKNLLKQSSDHTMFVNGAYVGFDPTAQSLHIGNLIPILGLIHAASWGVRPWALIGSATALVGDPTGRNSEKPTLDSWQIRMNASAISKQITKIFDNSQERIKNQLPELKIVNNEDWFFGMSFLRFLTEVGRKVKVNTMLSKNCVQSRLQSVDGLTFSEMSYQLMQGYDFYYLNKKHSVNVQLGGSDQWGNMVTGVELAEKLCDSQVGCLTMPLLTNSKGEKMGKSSGNGVWLDPSMTSVYDFYQYFASLSDEDVVKILPLLSLEEGEAVAAVIAEHEKQPERHLAQKHLAKSVTSLIHGAELADSAEKLSQMLFEKKFDFSQVRNPEAILTADRLRTFNLMNYDYVQVSAFLMEVFPEYTKSNIRNFLKTGAVSFDHEKLRFLDCRMSFERYRNKALLISLGKQSHYIVQIK